MALALAFVTCVIAYMATRERPYLTIVVKILGGVAILLAVLAMVTTLLPRPTASASDSRPFVSVSTWGDYADSLTYFAFVDDTTAALAKTVDSISMVLSNQAVSPFGKALVAIGKRRWRAAALHLDDALQQPGMDSVLTAEVYYYKGIVHQVDKDYESSLESYEQALRYYPDLTEALFGKAICQVRLGRFDDAERSFDDVFTQLYIQTDHKYGRKTNLNPARVKYLTGMAYLDLRAYGESDTYLSSATEMDSTYSEAWFGISVLSSLVEHSQRALASLEKIKSPVRQFRPEVWSQFSYVYADLGDTANLKTSLEAAKSLSQSDTEDVMRRAIVLFKLKQYSNCADILDKLVLLHDSLLEAWYYRGLAHLKKEPPNFSEARRSLRKASRSDQFNELAFLGLVKACLSLGDTSQAIAYLDSAVYYSPRTPAIWLGRAKVAAEAGFDEIATGALDTALLMGANHFLAYTYKLSQVYCLTGQQDMAIKVANYGLGIDSTWSELQKLADRISASDCPLNGF